MAKKRRKRPSPPDRKILPAGAGIRRVLLILARLGPLDGLRFEPRELADKFGRKHTDDFLRYDRKRPEGRRFFERIRVGLYRVADRWIEPAAAWLQSDEADRLRTLIAEEEAARFRRDEEELEEAARRDSLLDSARLVVKKRLEEEDRLRRTQIGRCVLALRAAGKPLTRAELRAKIGGRLANINIRDAVRDGRLVRLRVGLYDLPERADPPIARNSLEVILLILASQGELALWEIAKGAGFSRRVTRETHVKRLRARGLVERFGPMRYGLTSDGWERVWEILERKVEG